MKTSSIERERLTQIFKHIGMAGGNVRDAQEIVLKAHAGATLLADNTGDMVGAIGAALLDLVQGGSSAFDRIRPFTRQMPFNTPMLVGTDPLIAAVGGNGLSFPVAKYGRDGEGLTPVKVGGAAVATLDALKTAGGAQGLVSELEQAVGLATDLKFLADLAEDAGTTESATSDPAADLKEMLNGVNLSGYGNLFLVVGPGVANFLSTARAGADEDGPLLFPGMGPQGGTICNVQAIVSRALTDSALLVDATALVTGSEDMTISTSQNAMLEMNSDPDMEGATPTGPSGRMVSLFQVDAVGFMAIRSFAAKLARPSGVAVLESIVWGE